MHLLPGHYLAALITRWRPVLSCKGAHQGRYALPCMDTHPYSGRWKMSGAAAPMPGRRLAAPLACTPLPSMPYTINPSMNVSHRRSMWATCASPTL